MEPCSDSSSDEDSKNVHKKVTKRSKTIKPSQSKKEHDCEYETQNVKSNRSGKNLLLHRQSNSNQTGNKSKHQSFNASNDSMTVSEDEQEMDEEPNDDEEDEINEESVHYRIKNSVLEDSEEEEEEEDNGEVDWDPYAQIRKELKDMSFEDKQKLRNKLGAKIYNQIVHSDRTKHKAKDGKNKKIEKEFKDRPTEISAKKRVPVFRKVVQIKRKLNRDPRFDDLSGEFDEKKFKHTYGFLEVMKKREQRSVITAMKKEEDKTKKAELKSLANRYKQFDEAATRKERKSSLLNKWKEKEKQLVKGGKKPYFLKTSDIKKLQLAEMYNELKEKGRLEKYMTKKRKKNASKEKKKLHM